MPLPIVLSFVTGENSLVPWYLMASYLYYLKDISLLQDHEYDLVCKEILERWDNIDHSHKELISKDDLRAGTGFSLKEEDYPAITKNAALHEASQRGLI